MNVKTLPDCVCVLILVCLRSPRVQVLRAGFDRRSLWETRMTRDTPLGRHTTMGLLSELLRMVLRLTPVEQLGRG